MVVPGTTLTGLSSTNTSTVFGVPVELHRAGDETNTFIGQFWYISKFWFKKSLKISKLSPEFMFTIHLEYLIQETIWSRTSTKNVTITITVLLFKFQSKILLLLITIKHTCFRANTVATTNTAFFMTPLDAVMHDNCQVEEHGGDHRVLPLILKIYRSGQVF